MKHGPFDIVIEDGSHMWEHQITSLRTLFPFVREGGIYIVEDLQTNFGRQVPYRGVSSISCMEYLKRAVDLRVADAAVNIAAEEDAFLRTYARSMNLSFYKGCCLIQKQYDKGARTVAFPGEPIISIEEYGDSAALSVVAHISTTGDVFGERGSVKTLSPRENIQGFSLHLSAGFHGGLEYRARLDDGSWTGWVSSGEFAGTKGQSRDLTGFSVRLSDERAGAGTVKAIGLFRGEASPILTGADEDCVPGNGLGRLHGIQVILQRPGWP